MLSFLSFIAFAAEPVLLPPPPVHDDASAILQVWHPSGKIRVKADAGKILEQTQVQDGLVVRWMPPDVDAPTEVTIRMRARGAKEDTLAKVLVVPGFQAAIEVKPTRTLLDPGETSEVLFVTKTKPLVAVNAGTLGPFVADGDGWKATYTAPSLQVPTRAILVAADPAAPNEHWGTAIISLRAAKSLTVQAPPDSMSVLDVGGHDYGPVKASPAGTAPFDIKVDPDHPKARLTSTLPDGTTIVNEIVLPKAGPAMTFLPLPGNVPADTTITVIAACRDADGDPCDPAEVEARTTRGKAGTPRLLDGAIAVDYTPPEGNATLNLKYADTTFAWTRAAVEAPANVVLLAIPLKKNDFTVDARVKTAAGTPDLQHVPILDVSGATVTQKPKDKRDGSYAATIRLDKGAQFARVVASTGGVATGLQPRRVLAWATQATVPADGKSSAMLVIAVEDALGAPVPDVAVQLAVPLGDASVAPTVTTGKDGVARVKLRAGSTAGPIAVTATTGEVSATATLWQEGSGKPAALVPIGSEDDLAYLARWQSRVPTLFVSRGQKGPPATVGPPPLIGAPTVAGRVSRDAGPSATSAVVADAGPKAGPTKVKKAPRQAADTPFFRLRGTLIDRPHSVVATTSGKEGAEFAPDATWSASPAFGAVGLQADAEIWAIERKLGFDARGRAVAWRLRVGDSAPVQVPIEVEGGVRYKVVDTGTLSVAPGAGAFHTTARGVIYGDAGRTRAGVVSFPVTGARVGGSARYEPGPLLLALDLQSVWTPTPAILRAELGLDVPLSKALFLSAALGGDLRWLTLPSETADAALKLAQKSGEVRVGVSVAAF